MSKPKTHPGIQVRGDSYRVKYRGSDRSWESRTFSRLGDALEFQRATRVDLARGVWRDPAAANTPFGKVAESWANARRDLRASTLAQQDTALRVRILPAFADTAIASITYSDIEGFLAKMAAANLSPATQTKYLQILGQVLDHALRGDLITSNPIRLIKKGPGTKSAKKARFLAPADINSLSESVPARFRALVLLAGYRGLRYGEAVGLRPARLNLMAGEVSIEEILSEVGGSLSFGPPKTDEGIRKIGLPPFLVEALDQHMQDFPPQNDLIFTGEDGSMLRRSNFARRVFRPAVARAGIDPGLSFHGLRHSAVSILIAQGAALTEVATIMGWAKSSTFAMAGRYGHLYESRDDALTSAVEAAYQEAKAGAEMADVKQITS